jgi:hypothetical protein
MTCSSEITIGGHELRVMRYSYTVWEHFKAEDRVIRAQALPAHPRPNIHYMQREFVYSATAEVLRRRLARAGFTRTTLEQEFLKHYHAVCRLPGTMFFDRYPDAERAQARADAFRAATLDDWLEALAKTVEIGVTRVGRNAFEFTQPKNILVDIISGSDSPDRWIDCRHLMPQHSFCGFPCSSLNNMAVAMLEVVPGDALGEQEVTMFVEFKGDMTFDDMRLLKKPQAQYDDI